MLDQKRRVLTVLLITVLITPHIALGQASSKPIAAGSDAPSAIAPELATPSIAGGTRYQATQTGSEIQFLINVQVWGQVYKPGLYAVPDDTDIVGLLSYAGGPTEDASLGDVRLIRADETELPVPIDLESFIETGKLADGATLAPGDVLLVPANRSHKLLRFTNMMSFLTLAANVVILATRN